MLYTRSDPRITTANRINQQPILPPRHASASVQHYGPSRILPGSGPWTQYEAYGGGSALVPRDPQGGWDALGGAVMHVAQTDFLDSSPNVAAGYSRSGIYDVPEAAQSISFLRLDMTTSAHAVPSMPTGAWPTMFYVPPPSFSQQTIPVIAAGM